MQNYSFGQVIVLVGPLRITGFEEGDDVIQLARRVPTFALGIGADSNGVASKSADKSGTILLRLQQTSLSHTYLSSQFALMEADLLPSLPFLLKDAGNLVQLAAAANCVIEKPADAPYGTAHNAREWTLLAENLVLA